MKVCVEPSLISVRLIHYCIFDFFLYTFSPISFFLQKLLSFSNRCICFVVLVFIIKLKLILVNFFTLFFLLSTKHYTIPQTRPQPIREWNNPKLISAIFLQ